MGSTDELIDPGVVRRLRALVQQVDARLRERVNTVRDALLADLPPDFATTEQIVRALLEQPGFAGGRQREVAEGKPRGGPAAVRVA